MKTSLKQTIDHVINILCMQVDSQSCGRSLQIAIFTELKAQNLNQDKCKAWCSVTSVYKVCLGTNVLASL